MVRERHITTWHSFTPREWECDKIHKKGFSVGRGEGNYASPKAQTNTKCEPSPNEFAFFIRRLRLLTPSLAFASASSICWPVHRKRVRHATKSSCCRLARSCNLQPSDDTTAPMPSYRVFHPSAEEETEKGGEKHSLNKRRKQVLIGNVSNKWKCVRERVSQSFLHKARPVRCYQEAVTSLERREIFSNSQTSLRRGLLK